MNNIILAVLFSGVFMLPFAPAVSQDMDAALEQEASPEESLETNQEINNDAPPSNAGLIPASEAIANQQQQTSAQADAQMPDPSQLVPPSDIDVDLYFDSNSVIPESVQSRGPATRRINPQTEPASKFIVVEKNKSANAQQSQMIAAERAMTLGRYESALTFYDQMYAKNPKDASVILGRAIALQKLGRFEEAVSTYESLLDIEPDNADAHINMLGLISEKYPSVALQRLSDLREKYGDRVPLLGQIAITQSRTGNYNEALSTFGMIAAMEPENANHLYNMAIVSDKAGKKELAVKYYEKALEVDTIYNGGRSIPREQIFDRLVALR
jgi:tetratricopeptide (TPR) repeat protein